MIVAIVCGAATSIDASEVGSARNFGLGFQVGDPTAIVGKAYTGGGNAIDFGLGFARYGYGHCHRFDGDRCYRYRHVSLHGDYLWQENLVRSRANLDWHIGVGGRFIIWRDVPDEDLWMQARMPLGLDLTFARPSFLEVFFEIAPGFIVYPFLDFAIDAAIGVRFYF